MNNKFIVGAGILLLANVNHAAVPVNLSQQSGAYIKKYFVTKSKASASLDQLAIVSRDTDFNHTSHVRLQQTYNGIPVWNATSVIHVPNANNQITLSANLTNKTTMNGVLYENLEQDLTTTPASVYSNAQRDRALQYAKLAFEKKLGVVNLTYQTESVKNIIYLTDDNKAHYAFLVSLNYDDGQTGAIAPTTILDAETLKVYKTWDQILHSSYVEDDVLAGGIGGNKKTGPIVYDGSKGHIPVMQVHRVSGIEGNKGLSFCILKNNDIQVIDVSYLLSSYGQCEVNKKHNGIYWLSMDKWNKHWNKDEVNGGYSPSLDAFYNGKIVVNFYREWYNLQALVKEDKKTPMPLKMLVHYGRNYQNAFWDGEKMTFGDGGSILYPLTSLDVTAHEITHGFTQQNSSISPSIPQMAALHESFSDMAAVTIRYYATGKITWSIGKDIYKIYFKAIRYLDNPKKDGTSIDHMKNFNNYTEPHAGAGVFNKAFYLLATSKGWDIHKAFDVMLKANINYWTSSMKTLNEAACGVAAATKDYQYDMSTVKSAFSKVGIDISSCKIV